MPRVLNRQTGFELMSKSRVREIGSKGGSAPHKSSARQGGFRLLSKAEKKKMAHMGSEAAAKKYADNPELRKRWAKKAGIIAHARGLAHTFTHEEAVAAGRKSWEARKKKGIKTPRPVIVKKPPRTNWETVAQRNFERYKKAQGSVD